MGGSKQFFDNHGDTIVVAHFNKGMVTVLPLGGTRPLFGGPINRAKWEELKTDRFWPVDPNSPDEASGKSSNEREVE